MQINSTKDFDSDHMLKKFCYVKLQVKIKKNIQYHSTVHLKSLYTSLDIMKLETY